MTGQSAAETGGLEFTRPEKRSLTIRGHRTSVSLEQGFWEELRRISEEDTVSVSELAARIDAARKMHCGLASAIRQYVIHRLRRPDAEVAAPGTPP